MMHAERCSYVTIYLHQRPLLIYKPILISTFAEAVAVPDLPKLDGGLMIPISLERPSVAVDSSSSLLFTTENEKRRPNDRYYHSGYNSFENLSII